MTEPVWSAPLDASEADAGYTNSVTVATTQWDFVLDFQVSIPSAANAGQPVAQPVARLVMSPMHAKVLAVLIDSSVRAWERKYGPLPDTDTLIPGFAEKIAEAAAGMASERHDDAQEDQ